jgi:hypothetical protein
MKALDTITNTIPNTPIEEAVRGRVGVHRTQNKTRASELMKTKILLLL